jgi:voltage-gated potassium channel
VNAYGDVRWTVHRILDARARDTGLERSGNVVLGALILANVLAAILETVRPWRERYGAAFESFEALSVDVFIVEYVLRVWTCTLDQRYRRPVIGRLRYIVSPLALIDLAAIVPALLPGDVFLDLRFARAIRLVRMLRALKVARYSRTMQTFANVFRERTADLALIGIFLALLLVLSASLMYFAEHGTQPEVFSSIPAAMWWAVVTLTTVGYGDVYPMTPWGKCLGALIALIGIGFFALPAGILAAAFAEEVHKSRSVETKSCPHCGGALGPEG